LKEQNGAAMSLGRRRLVPRHLPRGATFRAGRLTEREAQELIDQFVMKLRVVRFLRSPEYDRAVLRATRAWVTEALGGVGIDGAALVTRRATASSTPSATSGPPRSRT